MNSPTHDRTSDSLVTPDDIAAAARRLRGVAARTPLLRSPALDQMLGATILVKAECLQHIGAFKFRGAYNFLSQLSPAQRERGVVAYSSGNHAQGVAYAAHLLGFAATIVMPVDAPAVKRDGARRWGAKICPYDRASESRKQIAEDIARETGASLARPFDDPAIIAGQGTVGLEIAEQLKEHGLRADYLLAPCGGGGLLAGVATAMGALCPQTAIYGVEPEHYDDHRRSLRAGRRVRLDNPPPTRCDALAASTPGEITWPINQSRAAGFLTAGEEETAEAIRVAFHSLKLVLEPGGAVALAAALGEKLPIRGKTIALIASGGNIDPQLFTQLLRETPA
ncbi:MAG: threonine/serine dehydratase [Gammaproteobacteria bacterium]|nr:threonine/serine dehydratase [Gammaproteobacteria bacterium]